MHAEKYWKELEFMVTPRTNQKDHIPFQGGKSKHKRVNYSGGCGVGQIQMRVQFVPEAPQSVGICSTATGSQHNSTIARRPDNPRASSRFTGPASRTNSRARA